MRAFDKKVALTLAIFSDLAYSHPDSVAGAMVPTGKNTFILDSTGIHYFESRNYEGYVFIVPGSLLKVDHKHAVVCSFRGTEIAEFEDLETDIKVRKTGAPLSGKAHRGFVAAGTAIWNDSSTDSGMESFVDAKRNLLASDDGTRPPLFITGHSLGGAMATIVAGLIAEDGGNIEGLYTFGSPRVGNADFCGAMNMKVLNHYRIVNNNDFVTRVPFRKLDYDHCGEMIYLSESKGIHQGTSSAYRFLDRLYGHIRGALELEIDGVDDHKMSRYIDALM